MANHFRDPQDPSKYQDKRDQIHLDEKWFFLTREKECYLLVSDKKNPKHCVKHKSHITKVMFLCAVARLRFNMSANCWWDGKLGIWPIGDWEPVQRGSKNRPKGTLVWKNKMVTKVVYRDLLINKLIPAILDKWPRRDRMSRTIYSQQDGAKTIFVRMTRNSPLYLNSNLFIYRSIFYLIENCGHHNDTVTDSHTQSQMRIDVLVYRSVQNTKSQIHQNDCDQNQHHNFSNATK